MANIKDEILFTQGVGIDTDSSKRLILKGDSDFVLNMIPNGSGEHGMRTSIRGNRTITGTTLDEGAETLVDFDPMIIQEVSQVSNPDYYHFGFTAKSPVTGKWVHICRLGNDHLDVNGQGIILRSDDGLTWTQDVSPIIDGAYDDRPAHGGYDGNGRLHVFWHDANGGVALQEKYIYSDDDGVTWSEIIIIQTYDTYDRIHTYGLLTDLRNGNLLQGAYGYLPDATLGIGYYLSGNRGGSWVYHEIINTGATYTYAEPSIVQISSTELLCIARVVLVPYNTTFRQFYSKDLGVTWEDQGYTTFDTWEPPGSARERQSFVTLITYEGRRIVVFYWVNTGDQKFKVIYANANDFADQGVDAWNTDTLYELMQLQNYPGFDFTRDGHQTVVHEYGKWGGIGSLYVEYTATPNKSNIRFFHTPQSNREDVLNALGFNDITVIGDCYDSKRNCKYIFAYGGNGYHSIYKYDIATDSLSYLLYPNDKIGLDSNYLINDACVIGDYLFWNPRSSSPRAINVEWAENYQLYDQVVPYTTYSVGDEIAVYGKIVEVIVSKTGTEIINDIITGTWLYSVDTKLRAYHTTDLYFYNYTAQPKTKPYAYYEDDTTRNVNHLRKLVFQFAYRYITHDGCVSITSPYSDAMVQSLSETSSGEIQQSITTENVLVVSLGFPDETQLSSSNVEYIELLVRTSEATGWGAWKVADKIKWGDIITRTSILYRFYNDKTLYVADQDEVSRSYSALPSLANAQCSLMNNRVAYAGLVEGIDIVTPVVTLTPNFQEISITYGGDVEHTYTVLSGSTNSVFYFISVPDSGNVIVINIGIYTWLYPVTAADTDMYVMAGRIKDFILADSTPFIVSVVSGAGYSAIDVANCGYVIVTTQAVVYDSSAIAYSSSVQSFFKTKGFKTGAVHKFCIFYADSLLRRSGAMYNEDTSFGTNIYLPFITEQTITNAEYIYKYNIDWSIHHKPPVDAVYWKLGYAGNTTMTYFIQTDITAFNLVGDAPYDNFSTIDITKWQETYAQDYPNVNIQPYEFHKGDRVRIITDGSGDTYPIPLDVLYDEEIIDFDTENNLIVISPFVSPSDIGNDSVIEIYRPQTSDDVIFHETGEWMEIYTDTDGERYHKGITQDQTAALPATGSLSEGDVYHITRYMAGTTNELYPVESMWASDFYDSEVLGYGKIGTEELIGKVSLNNVRYSDPYIQGTKINGLSSFQYGNYENVSNKYGDIVGLQEIGHTLRIYCEGNCMSFPVGRTEYTDASGQNNVIVSDKILGAIRIDADEYGTTFPESICKVGNYVYFFDARKGCFIRDSLNGSYPISGKFSYEGGYADFKMETYFKDKAKAIRSHGESNYKVLTGWDGDKKLLVVLFEDGYDGANDDIICFHEDSNRWVTHLIQENIGVSLGSNPSWLSKQGNLLMTYRDGDVYIHDDQADYCKFYGVQYGIACRVYSSQGNNVGKLFEAIEVHCNQKLDLDTIYVYTDETNEGYMQSRIPSGWWKRIEGAYMSAYLRNMLTNGTLATKDLFNGDFLRGYVIENRLSKSSVTSELNLFKVVISVNQSNV